MDASNLLTDKRVAEGTTAGRPGNCGENELVLPTARASNRSTIWKATILCINIRNTITDIICAMATHHYEMTYGRHTFINIIVDDGMRN
jgi:hypothetical protein